MTLTAARLRIVRGCSWLALAPNFAEEVAATFEVSSRHHSSTDGQGEWLRGFREP
jgi:hypothetical protein